MRQEMAILVDSLRLLLARKLFWVSLSISGMVAIAYASIGFTDTGVSMGFGAWEFENPILRKGTEEAETIYLLVFTEVIVRFWLAWFAVLLALISCASIFPEFLKGGSVDLFLSKPIGRVRLFLWKYLGGLLFVAVQVLLAAGDLCLQPGLLRGGVDRDGDSLDIVFPVGRHHVLGLHVDGAVQRGRALSAGIHDAGNGDGNGLFRRRAQGQRQGAGRGVDIAGGDLSPGDRAELERIQKEYQYRHSTAYVIWTSAGFELVVLALAAGWFVRKDY